MKRIPLTQGQYALVDDGMYDDLMTYKWHAWLSKSNRVFYARMNARDDAGKWHTVFMHRYIIKCSQGELVDHINMDGLDNQLSNLRACTSSQNQMNRPKNRTSKSGYKGVTWHKSSGKWMAQINTNGRYKYLGIFDNKHEAGNAYNLAAIMYHGDFAYTNESKVNNKEKQ